VNRLSAKQFAHAVAHFMGCIDGVSEGKDLSGSGVTFANQPFDAVGEHRGLAGSSSGDNQHRPMEVLDGCALAIVRNE